MLPFKPMKKRDYLRWVRKYQWDLIQAGSGDWMLVNENGDPLVLFIKVTHPGGEVIAEHVKKTEKIMMMKGLKP